LIYANAVIDVNEFTLLEPSLVLSRRDDSLGKFQISNLNPCQRNQTQQCKYIQAIYCYFINWSEYPAEIEDECQLQLKHPQPIQSTATKRD